MKNDIREIGLEKELFLIQNNIIKEPSLFGFPADEMGFLVEIRSLPSDRAYPVITTLFNEQLQYQLRANKFGMKLYDEPYKFESKEFVDHIESTYHISRFTDYTQNIYQRPGVTGNQPRLPSHHLGVFPVRETSSPITKEPTLYRLTAGIHVHFSNRDSETGHVLELPIEEIVKQMDESFAEDIERTKRIKGEWEPKKHGFEYRSLPCDVDVTRVVKEAFRILRCV